MDYRGRGTVLLALHMTVIEDRSMPVTAAAKSNKHPGSHK